MEAGLTGMFEYMLDNWYFCLTIVAVGLNYRNKYCFHVCLVLSLVTGIGHFISPYIYGLDIASKVWELYGIFLRFIELSIICLLIIKNRAYGTVMSFAIGYLILAYMVFKFSVHIDWQIIKTDFMASIYAPIIQLLNGAVVAVMLINGFIVMFGRKINKYGVYKSRGDSDNFSARVLPVFASER